MDKYGLQPSQFTYQKKNVAIEAELPPQAEQPVEESQEPKPDKKRWKLW
jgi:hypothetical protein